jgi:hypothetical protein
MSKDEKKCDEEKWTLEELEACLESGPLAICPPHRFLTFRARTDFFGMTSENYYDHVIQVDIIFKDRCTPSRPSSVAMVVWHFFVGNGR